MVTKVVTRGQFLLPSPFLFRLSNKTRLSDNNNGRLSVATYHWSYFKTAAMK